MRVEVFVWQSRSELTTNNTHAHVLYSLYQSCIAGASSFCNSSFLYLQPCVKCKSQVVEELIVSVSALNILFLFIFVFTVVIETEILCSHILSVISLD